MKMKKTQCVPPGIRCSGRYRRHLISNLIAQELLILNFSYLSSHLYCKQSNQIHHCRRRRVQQVRLQHLILRNLSVALSSCVTKPRLIHDRHCHQEDWRKNVLSHRNYILGNMTPTCCKSGPTRLPNSEIDGESHCWEKPYLQQSDELALTDENGQLIRRPSMFLFTQQPSIV